MQCGGRIEGQPRRGAGQQGGGGTTCASAAACDSAFSHCPTNISVVRPPTGVVATSFVVRVPVKRTVNSDPWSVGAVLSDGVFLAIQYGSVSLTSITVYAVWRVPRSCLTAVRLPAREGGSHLPGGMSPVQYRSRTHRWSQGWSHISRFGPLPTPHVHASRSVASASSHDSTPRPRSHSNHTLFWSHSNNLTFILPRSHLRNVHSTTALLFILYIINEKLAVLFSH